MSTTLAAGTRIGDRYELIALLGAGGMGAVYRARQLNLGREVALKILLPSDSEGPEEALRRFAREARVASAIKHPNVIEIYDVGEQDGLTYLAMELLHGHSLREHLAARGETPRAASLGLSAEGGVAETRSTPGTTSFRLLPLDENPGARRHEGFHRGLLGDDPQPMPLEAVLDLATPLAEALIAAHAVGAVHRDLKPENIFLERVGPSTRVVVLDFGLAFIEEDDHLGRLTRHGVIMGTPDYLSPEQARGAEVGPASDVYSLGCVLYELIGGKPPFRGSQLNVLTQHLYVSPEPPLGAGNLPRELVDLVMAMLRKRPEERPRIDEILEQLELLAGTLAGRRKRGRDATLLRSRAERMLSFSPTAPLPGVTPQPGTSADLRVAIVGELADEIELGLLSNDMALVRWDMARIRGDMAPQRPHEDDEGNPIDLIFAAAASPAEVATLVATGLPVVAALRDDDRQSMGELARAGASEITTLPLAIDNLVRALRRAKKRADRRRR